MPATESRAVSAMPATESTAASAMSAIRSVAQEKARQRVLCEKEVNAQPAAAAAPDYTSQLAAFRAQTHTFQAKHQLHATKQIHAEALSRPAAAAAPAPTTSPTAPPRPHAVAAATAAAAAAAAAPGAVSAPPLVDAAAAAHAEAAERELVAALTARIPGERLALPRLLTPPCGRLSRMLALLRDSSEPGTRGAGGAARVTSVLASSSLAPLAASRAAARHSTTADGATGSETAFSCYRRLNALLKRRCPPFVPTPSPAVASETVSRHGVVLRACARGGADAERQAAVAIERVCAAAP